MATMPLHLEGAATRVPSFEDFYTATFRDLSRYAWRLTRDDGLGDELAQEALTRVCARWPLMRDARPYAFRVVTNLARDHWRREVLDRAAQRELARPETTPGPDAADGAVLDAVRRLSPPLRDAVALHYYADLPVDEVARVLRRPVGTVKRRLFDARAQLAQTLEESR
jgi:RNA polymerase sigma-70 factor (ECF subfamily)